MPGILNVEELKFPKDTVPDNLAYVEGDSSSEDSPAISFSPDEIRDLRRLRIDESSAEALQVATEHPFS